MVDAPHTSGTVHLPAGPRQDPMQAAGMTGNSMDSFELNKIAGAVIGACLLAMVVGKISGGIVHPTAPAKPVFEAADEAPATATAAAAPVALEPIAPLLAKANLANGEAAFNKRCATCHTANDGGANKVGPNLWGVVGGELAHLEGFSYSKAMQEKGGKWDYEALNAFLHKPQAYVKGTKMAFAGLSNDNERADIIAWLRAQDPSPEPLPQ